MSIAISFFITFSILGVIISRHPRLGDGRRRLIACGLITIGALLLASASSWVVLGLALGVILGVLPWEQAPDQASAPVEEPDLLTQAELAVNRIHGRSDLEPLALSALLDSFNAKDPLARDASLRQAIMIARRAEDGAAPA